MLLFGCAGRRPPSLGLRGGALGGCPPTPNCVSSTAHDVRHRVAPLSLRAAPEQAWRRIQQVIASWPRTRIVHSTSAYLHAECASRLVGFIDDLELQLRAEQDEVAVRSASRVGYWDLGVNRRRVEALREALRGQGVVR